MECLNSDYLLYIIGFGLGFVLLASVGLNVAAGYNWLQGNTLKVVERNKQEPLISENKNSNTLVWFLTGALVITVLVVLFLVV